MRLTFELLVSEVSNLAIILGMNQQHEKIQRALVSVYDKTNLLEIANALAQRGVEILSTGGTARHLRDAGI